MTAPARTSVAIVKTDLARLQKIKLTMSAKEGRPVPLWELVHEAVMLLVAKKECE
jgi:hypothetical protein